MKLSEKIRQQTGNHKDMPLDAMISLCALDQWADEAELLEAEIALKADYIKRLEYEVALLKEVSDETRS